MALSLLSTRAQSSSHLLEYTKAWGFTVADFDHDGHDDIFITGHDSNDHILYWTPTGYMPSSQTLPWVDRHDCDAADVNLDGLLDMYCTLGANHGQGVKENELWLQQSNGLFAKQTNFGAEDPYGRGRYPQFFNFNNDGYPDLYITNEATQRPDGHENVNRVFANQKGKGFLEVHTLATGARGFRCVTKGDINKDGWDDLLVCGDSPSGHIYINNRAGDFEELATAALNKHWNDAKLVDMNNDGLDDLVVLTVSNGLQIWLNTGHSPYYIQPAFEDHLIGKAASLTVGDFNHDGIKDIYVVLHDSNCSTTHEDAAPDVTYSGNVEGSWTKQTQSQQFDGCGHLAATVDGDKVLLENGNVSLKGPNYILEWPRP